MFASLIAAVVSLLIGQESRNLGRPFEELKFDEGQSVRYLIATPPMYKPEQAYPVLVAVVQTQTVSEGDADNELSFIGTWEAATTSKGWVAVCVSAPRGRSLSDLSGERFGLLLDTVASKVHVRDDRFYVASDSSHDLVRVAAANSGRLRAIGIALDAFAPEELEQFRKFLGVPVVCWYDPTILKNSKPAIDAIAASGVELRPLRTVAMGLPIIKTKIFDLLEQPATSAEAEIGSVLDSLHAAAAKADEKAYFDLYAKDAVFLGTDAKERWTLDEFKTFAHPYFAKGKAWTYTPIPGKRHIVIEGKDHDVAWFDEQLDNAKLGRCRGSGVLIKEGGSWRIKQYNLTMLVPNEIAEQVAKQSAEVKPAK
jgi:hypothetical protein